MNIRKILDDHRKWLRGEGGKRADLSRTSLFGANLYGAELRGADLYETDLGGANLVYANLIDVDLRRSNFAGADLVRATLDGADLSGAKGLLSASDWIANKFYSSSDGVIVYKRIGYTQHAQPDHWKIEPGSTISEVCNPCRTTECGCGVNFGTRKWCEDNYPEVDLWECLIPWRDLPGVVVPYNTNGKARCERLVLVRNLTEALRDERE